MALVFLSAKVVMYLITAFNPTMPVDSAGNCISETGPLLMKAVDNSYFENSNILPVSRS